MRIAGLQSNTGAQRRASRLVIVLLLLSAGWLALWFFHARSYWEEAAFIHLEYARSLAHRQGFRFNGRLVYGDSAPLWICLLTGMHMLIPNWIAAGKTLAVLSTTFALAGVFEFARSTTRDLGTSRSRTFSAAMVLLIAANPLFALWSFSGMEAVAATGLACWGLAAASGPLRQPITPRRLLLGCACAGFAPLLRPEMVLFTALVGLILFVRWVNSPLRFGPKLLVFFSGFLLVGAPVIAWSLYALHVFGSVVPNTYAAVVAAPNESTTLDLLRTYALAFPLIFLGVLALAAWMVFRHKLEPRSSGEDAARALDATGWMPFIWTAVTCSFFLAHHAHVLTRYLLVSAPALTVALLAFARKLWPRLYLVATSVGVLLGIATSLLTAWPLVSNEAQRDRDYTALAAFVRTLPARAPVATNRVAQIAFLSEHPVIDMSGLMRPAALPFRWDVTDNRRVWWAHDQGAGYMVLDHAPEPKSTKVWSRDIAATGWSLEPREHGAFDKLTLWKLPPSPTLPVAANMPTEDEP